MNTVFIEQFREQTIYKKVRRKCVPVLLYGLEICPLKQRDIRSLDF